MLRKMLLLLLVSHLSGLQAQDCKVLSLCREHVEETSQSDAILLSEAAALVAPYEACADSIMDQVLGLSRVTMSKGRPESLLGNWVADVMVEGGTATGLDAADMGLFNLSGLRNSMPEGIVRCGDVMLISPFENYLVVLEMRGSDLLRLMKNIAAVGGEGVSSSVRMEISADGRLLSCTIGGEKIHSRRIYTVATTDYLADGNDGMTALRKAVKRHDIGVLARDVMMEYVLKHRIIDSKIEGRIVVK